MIGILDENGKIVRTAGDTFKEPDIKTIKLKDDFNPNIPYQFYIIDYDNQSYTLDIERYKDYLTKSIWDKLMRRYNKLIDTIPKLIDNEVTDSVMKAYTLKYEALSKNPDLLNGEAIALGMKPEDLQALIKELGSQMKYSYSDLVLITDAKRVVIKRLLKEKRYSIATRSLTYFKTRHLVTTAVEMLKSVTGYETLPDILANTNEEDILSTR